MWLYYVTITWLAETHQFVFTGKECFLDFDRNFIGEAEARETTTRDGGSVAPRHAPIRSCRSPPTTRLEQWTCRSFEFFAQ
jgi:hypothetical protein